MFCFHVFGHIKTMCEILFAHGTNPFAFLVALTSDMSLQRIESPVTFVALITSVRC